MFLLAASLLFFPLEQGSSETPLGSRTAGHMAPIPGTKLGSYRILERLGAGGMGEVYLAYDPRLGRRVAIKLLPAGLAADGVARERLRGEALAAAALDHPFICKIFEVAEDNGALYFVMEYVRGETLSARMRAGRVRFPKACAFAGEIAEAAEEAHASRFVHRDLILVLRRPRNSGRITAHPEVILPVPVQKSASGRQVLRTRPLIGLGQAIAQSSIASDCVKWVSPSLS